MRTQCCVGFSCLVALVCAVAPRAADAGSRPLDFEYLYEYLGMLSTSPLQSPTSAAGDYVLRDQESWCAFWWTAIVGRPLPPSSCPEVDFRHETVIASIAGPQPTSCHGIRVDAVERFPGRAVEVSVIHTEPISDCLAVFNNPVEIVVVSGPIGAVEFVHEYVQGGGCGFGLVDGDVQTQCGFASP